MSIQHRGISVSGLPNEDDEMSDLYDDQEWIQRCLICGGEGTVNPLTAPEGFFCAGVADCPACDGTGEAP
jgi:DnaJ-class molecular chaperone